MFRRAFELLATAPPAYCAGAVLLYALSVVLAGWRWQAVLGALGERVRLSLTSAGVLVGIFVSNVTPTSGVGGELGRVSWLLHRSAVPGRRAALSIALDRLADLAPISLLFAISLPTLGALGGRLGRVWVLVALGLVVVSLLMLARRIGPPRNRLAQLLGSLPELELDRRRLGAAVGFSTLIWIQDLARLTVVAAAFGIVLTPTQAATLACLGLLGGLVPTFGGLGAVEGSLVATLVLFGVARERALAIIFLERGISYLASTLAGGLVLLCTGGFELCKRIRLRSSAIGISRE